MSHGLLLVALVCGQKMEMVLPRAVPDQAKASRRVEALPILRQEKGKDAEAREAAKERIGGDRDILFSDGQFL